MIGPTSKITIPEKPCGINQTQMDRLRLLVSSSSSRFANLKINSIISRLMTRVLKCSQNLILLGERNDIKLEEVASSKIASISSMQHFNSLRFILSNIKVNIFSTMVLSEMIKKYNIFSNMTNLFCTGYKFHFTQKDEHPALGPKNLVPTPLPSPLEQNIKRQ